jgi:hypothetical protein
MRTPLLDINTKILGDRELAHQLAQLSSTAIPKAIRDGVRYASRGAKTSVAKEVGAVTPVPSKRIKDDLSVALEGQGDSAVVKASSKPISALRFKPTQLKTGIRLTLYKGQRTLVPKGTMRPTRKAPGRGALPFRPSSSRTYSGDTGRAKPRKGLEFIQGLSVASMYLGGKHADTMQQQVAERVSEQLETGILRSLGGQARGFGRG